MSNRKQFCDLSTRQKNRRLKQQLEADIGGQDAHHCIDEPTHANTLLNSPVSTMNNSQAHHELTGNPAACDEETVNPTTLLEKASCFLPGTNVVDNDGDNTFQDGAGNLAGYNQDNDTSAALLKNPTPHLPCTIEVNDDDGNNIAHCLHSDSLPTQRLSDSDPLTNPHHPRCDMNEESERHGEFSLLSELSLWALLCYVPHGTLTLLLKLLRKAGHNELPMDARTLLRTPRKSHIQKFSQGLYIHYGLEGALLHQLANCDVTTLQSEIQIDINVDGLPLAKNSQSSLWPVLGRIVQPGFHTPFVIGAYHYSSKPSSAEEYLTPFVEEYIKLHNEGFYYEGRKYIPSIRAVICDSPARCFVTCTKQYNGYYGCPKCTTEGTYLRFVTFPELDAPLRTDEAFKNRYQEEHHTGTSPFERASLNMVTQFPLDYMHVILLGVMKKLLQLWFGLKGLFKPYIRARVSKRLVSLRKWMPREFSRKPRGLKELKMWKATEFRLFLLYIGPSILRDILPEKYLRHFTTLHSACRILCDPADCMRNNTTAKDLLTWFVRRYIVLYGAAKLVSNVHNLIHISDDVKLFGPLDSYSAFPFENFMQTLKRLLRSPTNPLQQLHRRLIEMMGYMKPVDECQKGPILLRGFNGNLPLGCSRPHTAIRFPQFYLSTKQSDNCCYMKDGSVVVIEHIGYRNEQPVVLGRKFKQLLGMPLYPFDSRLNDMYLASKQSHLSVWLVSDITRKAVMFPFNTTQFSIMPLLHGSDH